MLQELSCFQTNICAMSVSLTSVRVCFHTDMTFSKVPIHRIKVLKLKDQQLNFQFTIEFQLCRIWSHQLGTTSSYPSTTASSLSPQHCSFLKPVDACDPVLFVLSICRALSPSALILSPILCISRAFLVASLTVLVSLFGFYVCSFLKLFVCLFSVSLFYFPFKIWFSAASFLIYTFSLGHYYSFNLYL